MSARVRKANSKRRTNTFPEPSEIVEFLEHIHAGSTTAFNNLVNNGADARELRKCLWWNLCALVMCEVRNRSFLPKSRPQVTTYKLRRFLKRLEGVAKEIEHINSTLWPPLTWCVEPPDVRPGSEVHCDHLLGISAEESRLMTDYDALPTMLRVYAKRLKFHRKAQQRRLRRKRWNAYGRAQLMLLGYIYQSTGKHFYRPAAELLTACVQAIGVDEDISTDRLKMLYHTNRPTRQVNPHFSRAKGKNKRTRS